MLLDDLQQDALGVLAAVVAVEREAVLLAHEHRPAHRLGHGLHEPDHVLRLLNGAVREEQVDQDPRLDVLERPEVALDRPQRLGSLAPRLGEALFQVG